MTIVKIAMGAAALIGAAQAMPAAAQISYVGSSLYGTLSVNEPNTTQHYPSVQPTGFSTTPMAISDSLSGASYTNAQTAQASMSAGAFLSDLNHGTLTFNGQSGVTNTENHYTEQAWTQADFAYQFTAATAFNISFLSRFVGDGTYRAWVVLYNETTQHQDYYASFATGTSYNTQLLDPGSYAMYLFQSESALLSNTSGAANSWMSGSTSFAVNAAAVPEPAAWALMLGGFGMVGGAMRMRRRPAVQFG